MATSASAASASPRKLSDVCPSCRAMLTPAATKMPTIAAGQQPAGAPREEAPERHAARRPELRQDQAGDEEAGQREERRETEEAALEPVVVERQHRNQRERPQAVEAGLVAQAASRTSEESFARDEAFATPAGHRFVRWRRDDDAQHASAHRRPARAYPEQGWLAVPGFVDERGSNGCAR